MHRGSTKICISFKTVYQKQRLNHLYTCGNIQGQIRVLLQEPGN